MLLLIRTTSTSSNFLGCFIALMFIECRWLNGFYEVRLDCSFFTTCILHFCLYTSYIRALVIIESSYHLRYYSSHVQFIMIPNFRSYHVLKTIMELIQNKDET